MLNDYITDSSGFYLIISGCAEIVWFENDSEDKRETYRGQEKLLQAKVALIAPSSGKLIEKFCSTYVCVVNMSLSNRRRRN